MSPSQVPSSMVEPEVMAALVPRFRSKITNHDSQGDNRAGAIETRYGHSLSYGYPRNYSGVDCHRRLARTSTTALDLRKLRTVVRCPLAVFMARHVSTNKVGRTIRA